LTYVLAVVFLLVVALLVVIILSRSGNDGGTGSTATPTPTAAASASSSPSSGGSPSAEPSASASIEASPSAAASPTGTGAVPTARAVIRELGVDDRASPQAKPRVLVFGSEGGGDVAVKLQAATGGSLCVHRSRLPPDFAAVLTKLCEPDTRVQLFVCSQGRRACEPSLVVPIHVPRLSVRKHELPRIVDEFALDAAAALGASPALFTGDDRAWVLEHGASSLSEIEKATLRLTARSISGSINEAAARLGMASISLTRWLRRRTPPKGLLP
jgi:hypothetical protein